MTSCNLRTPASPGLLVLLFRRPRTFVNDGCSVTCDVNHGKWFGRYTHLVNISVGRRSMFCMFCSHMQKMSGKLSRRRAVPAKS